MPAKGGAKAAKKDKAKQGARVRGAQASKAAKKAETVFPLPYIASGGEQQRIMKLSERNSNKKK